MTLAVNSMWLELEVRAHLAEEQKEIEKKKCPY